MHQEPGPDLGGNRGRMLRTPETSPVLPQTQRPHFLPFRPCQGWKGNLPLPYKENRGAFCPQKLFQHEISPMFRDLCQQKFAATNLRRSGAQKEKKPDGEQFPNDKNSSATPKPKWLH